MILPCRAVDLSCSLGPNMLAIKEHGAASRSDPYQDHYVGLMNKVFDSYPYFRSRGY